MTNGKHYFYYKYYDQINFSIREKLRRFVKHIRKKEWQFWCSMTMHARIKTLSKKKNVLCHCDSKTRVLNYVKTSETSEWVSECLLCKMQANNELHHTTLQNTQL